MDLLFSKDNPNSPFFESVIERLKDLLSLGSDKELSEILKMTPAAFNNRKRSGSLPYKQIIDVGNKQNVNLNWLLTGEGPVYKDQIPSSEDQKTPSEKTISSDHEASNVTKVVIEHQDTIKRFKNPEKAKEFNEFLVEIEDNDPEGYDELYKEAKVIYKTIKRIKNKDLSKDDNQDKKIS